MAVRELSGWGELRDDLTAKLVSQGAEQKRAERVAEATVRRAQAREEQRVFYYADVQYELEDLCRSAGVGPDGIDHAVRKVWSVAREIAEEHGCSVEEALFFCFHESVDVHRESLADEAGPDGDAEASSNGDAEANPNGDAGKAASNRDAVRVRSAARG